MTHLDERTMSCFRHTAFISFSIYSYSKLLSMVIVTCIFFVKNAQCDKHSPYCESTKGLAQHQRLIGNMITLTNIIGPKMCMNKCLKRNCWSVNYKKDTLECELNSHELFNITRGLIFQDDPNFVFINVSKSNGEERITFNHLIINSSKEDNYFCTTLKSNSIVCLEGFRPRDCKDLRDQGSTSNGVYTLYPARGVVIKSYCDMRSDGGGWTAFQKRSNESVDFFRTWIDYKIGFGDIEGNYWLGNDNLHLLLRNGESEMRMDMEDFQGNTRFIQYSSFTVGNEESGYRATLSKPSGNVEDCWTSNDFGRIYNTEFATKDRDNQGNCSNKYKGGWWYVRCHCANPNGLYLSGPTSVFAEGMTYKPWLGHYYSLKYCELKIRRK